MSAETSITTPGGNITTPGGSRTTQDDDNKDAYRKSIIARHPRLSAVEAGSTDHSSIVSQYPRLEDRIYGIHKPSDIHYFGFGDRIDDKLQARQRRRAEKMSPRERLRYERESLYQKYLNEVLEPKDEQLDQPGLISLAVGRPERFGALAEEVRLLEKEYGYRNKIGRKWELDRLNPYMDLAKMIRYKRKKAFDKAPDEEKLTEVLSRRKEKDALFTMEQFIEKLFKTATEGLKRMEDFQTKGSDLTKMDAEYRKNYAHKMIRAKLDFYLKNINNTNFDFIPGHVKSPLVIYKNAISKKFRPMLFHLFRQKINAQFRYEVIKANYDKMMDAIYFKPKLYRGLFRTIGHVYRDLISRSTLMSRVIGELEKDLTHRELANLIKGAGQLFNRFLNYWGEKKEFVDRKEEIEWQRVQSMDTNTLLRYAELRRLKEDFNKQISKRKDGGKPVGRSTIPGETYLDAINNYLIALKGSAGGPRDKKAIEEDTARYRNNVRRMYYTILSIVHNMVKFSPTVVPLMMRDKVLHKDPATVLILDFIIFQRIKENVRYHVPHFDALERARAKIIDHPVKLYLRKIPVSMFTLLMTYTTFFPLVYSIVNKDVIPFIKKVAADGDQAKYKKIEARLLHNANYVRDKDGIKKEIAYPYKNLFDLTMRNISQKLDPLKDINFNVRRVFHSKKRRAAEKRKREIKELETLKEKPLGAALIRVEKRMTDMIDMIKANSKKLGATRKKRKTKKKKKPFAALTEAEKKARKMRVHRTRSALAKRRKRGPDGKFLSADTEFQKSHKQYSVSKPDKYDVDHMPFDKEKDPLLFDKK